MQGKKITIVLDMDNPEQKKAWEYFSKFSGKARANIIRNFIQALAIEFDGSNCYSFENTKLLNEIITTKIVGSKLIPLQQSKMTKATKRKEVRRQKDNPVNGNPETNQSEIKSLLDVWNEEE